MVIGNKFKNGEIIIKRESNLDNDFIGLTKDEDLNLCKERNLRSRITMENGQSFIVTMDYRLDRINFHIENNIVVSQKRG